MKAQVLFRKIVPATLVAAPLVHALSVFSVQYNDGAAVPLIVNIEESTNRTIFYLNFYLPFALCAAVLFVGLFASSRYVRGICLVPAFAAAVLCVYSLDDIFTIKIYMYAAYLVAAAFAFPLAESFILVGGAVPLLLLFMLHPAFMGKSPFGADFANPSGPETASVITFLILFSAMVLALRFFMDKYLFDKAALSHLKSVDEKLVLFNQKLQELAKQRGEEAVKEERLRFTRDLHDSCGYAFTSIILVTDAAVSCGQMEAERMQETFQRIRSLAGKGLNETRETLYSIRKLREPYTDSVQTIHQLAAIFREVTGIPVEVVWGNIQQEYGTTVNKIIARIMQEAFTNSIRHGKATRITVHFWEFPQVLAMTVTDNGIGARLVIKGIGLAGMEERLSAVGGSLEASLPEEGGFRLKITIPVVEKSLQVGGGEQLWMKS
jgi:signal transduction histidine kinase